MIPPADSTSRVSTDTRIVGDTPLRARRRRVGYYISLAGLIFLFPMMFCAVFIEEGRGLFALLALLSWVVWKVGRTMTKLNSPEELR